MTIHTGHFYHSLLRNYTIVIGSILDGLEVIRYTNTGTEDSRIKVPVAYSPKEKFIRRLLEDPTLEAQPAMTLPRIGFEMTGMQYAPDRKLSSRQEFIFRSDTTSNIGRVYTPVAYDIIFEASIVAKTQEDMLQIIEQIVPFFTPDYTVSFRGIKTPTMNFDVPITLDTIQRSDNYEGRFEDRRMIIWTLSFVVKGFLFGPVRTGGIIKHIDLTYYDMSQVGVPQNQRQFIVDYDIEPYLNGVPLGNINYFDDYTIKTDVTYG
jgi:hypothetical protein